MPSGMQKNKLNYPSLAISISGGLIYSLPVDTSELCLSALISGDSARFITAMTSPWRSCTLTREPSGLPAQLCLHSCRPFPSLAEYRLETLPWKLQVAVAVGRGSRFSGSGHGTWTIRHISSTRRGELSARCPRCRIPCPPPAVTPRSFPAEGGGWLGWAMAGGTELWAASATPPREALLAGRGGCVTCWQG